MTLSLPIAPEATKLLHDSPLALLLGMLLDQQIPMEKAFSSPYVLKQWLGHDLDAGEIVAKPPALHRFPRANEPPERPSTGSTTARPATPRITLWSYPTVRTQRRFLPTSIAS
jgi:hypothetical protein